MTWISWKLTIKTPERRQWLRFGVFIVNFEHISHLVSIFTLNNQMLAGLVEYLLKMWHLIQIPEMLSRLSSPIKDEYSNDFVSIINLQDI